MEEKNIKKEDNKVEEPVTKKIVLKKIRPLFTTVITTMDCYTAKELQDLGGGIIDSSKMRLSVKEFQRVIAVGDSVRNISEGDYVKINPTEYGRAWHKPGTLDEATNSIKDNMMKEYNFKTVEINGEVCLVLTDRDIVYIAEKYEWEEVKPKKIPIIEVPKKHIIL